MKKISLLLVCFNIQLVFSQFKVNIEANVDDINKNVILYSQNGSKEFIISKIENKRGKWVLDVPTNYKGFLRAYFPEMRYSFNFVSDNKDVHVKLEIKDGKIIKENYLDAVNREWREMVSLHQKREAMLPVLYKVRGFYNDESNFDIALKNEIIRLEKTELDIKEDSFIKYYLHALRYANRDASLSYRDYKDFLLNSSVMLETSTLMKPILTNFLRVIPQNDLIKEIDILLEELDLSTNRGQVVLSELLSIFDVYGLEIEKKIYLEKASALTCSINENLKTSINSIKKTSVGAVFEDYIFTPNVRNTSVKKISEVKADKKIILFWSSTCSHCLSELPMILEKYELLKQKGIQVIGISLDNNKSVFEKQTAVLPWINDTELEGWKSSFVEKYNIQATPTYYVLDSKGKIIDKPRNFSVFLKSINVK